MSRIGCARGAHTLASMAAANECVCRHARRCQLHSPHAHAPIHKALSPPTRRSRARPRRAWPPRGSSGRACECVFARVCVVAAVQKRSAEKRASLLHVTKAFLYARTRTGCSPAGCCARPARCYVGWPAFECVLGAEDRVRQARATPGCFREQTALLTVAGATAGAACRPAGAFIACHISSFVCVPSRKERACLAGGVFDNVCVWPRCYAVAMSVVLLLSVGGGGSMCRALCVSSTHTRRQLCAKRKCSISWRTER